MTQPPAPLTKYTPESHKTVLAGFPSSWRAFLGTEIMDLLEVPLGTILKKPFYPDRSEIFKAFQKTPPNEVKVVLLGQDPYHGPGQAHGLSFSVPAPAAIPPSLRNIYKELSDDLGNNLLPHSGDLSAWAAQGVLLLNAVLSVAPGEAGSHQKSGWQDFTDGVIKRLNQDLDHLVFILWGNYAQKKRPLIDPTKHLVITSVHPSPLAAHRGFFGSRPFSKTNHYLASKGKTPINWMVGQEAKK